MAEIKIHMFSISLKKEWDAANKVGRICYCFIGALLLFFLCILFAAIIVDGVYIPFLAVFCVYLFIAALIQMMYFYMNTFYYAVFHKDCIEYRVPPNALNLICRKQFCPYTKCRFLSRGVLPGVFRPYRNCGSQLVADYLIVYDADKKAIFAVPHSERAERLLLEKCPGMNWIAAMK